jgi:1,4-alpha-glucan branching enzyme
VLKRNRQIQGVTKLTFAIPLDKAPAGVSVVGEFNGWDPDTHPMKKRSNGTRSVTVELPTGRSWEYRYVAADGTWFSDPEAETHVPNPFGESNSVVST